MDGGLRHFLQEDLKERFASRKIGKVNNNSKKTKTPTVMKWRFGTS